MTDELQHDQSSQLSHGQDIHLDQEIQTSGLLPRKKELHQKFILTLQQVLPHLGKDETKIVSALIILALKLEGIIGKEISDQDSQLIEILKDCVFGDKEKHESALSIAEKLTNAMASNAEETSI